MEYTIKKQGDITRYYKDKKLKYEHSKDSKGYEWWAEYDKKGKEIHFKNSDGYEKWADGYPKEYKEPETIDEKDIKPFQFGL